LLDGIADGSWFYFVHSFALPTSPQTIGTAMHAREFAAINSRNNFHAAQFHPERSAAAGSRFLQNFLAIPA
jgi:glutamine amidotransferase